LLETPTVRLLVYSVLISICLVLPSALLLWLWRSRAASRAHLLVLSALTAVVLVVLTFSSLGAWYAFGGFWPALFAAAFAAIVFTRLRRGLPRAWLPRRWSKEFFLTGVNLVHAALWCSLLPLLWLARSYDGEPLELSSPLRGGRYTVMGGGANASVNHHAFIPSQRYALDLVELNGFGVRAAGLSPDALNDYVIFGAPVVAPCDGEIASVADALADRPLMDPDLEHPLGNHVVILCGGDSVVLAHLERGSISVAVGDRVAAGGPIGNVGNSGSTMEPHLHIHAVRGQHADAQGEGVPLRIDGRFLIKGDSLGP
jgi:hypothetical protein